MSKELERSMSSSLASRVGMLYNAASAVPRRESVPATTVPAAVPNAAQRAATSRGRRVLLLLAAIWLISAWDYVLTVIAVRYGLADEINPIAAGLLRFGPVVLFWYKALLVATPSLLVYRKRCFTEVMTLVALAALVLVAFQWKAVFDLHEMAWLAMPMDYNAAIGAM